MSRHAVAVGVVLAFAMAGCGAHPERAALGSGNDAIAASGSENALAAPARAVVRDPGTKGPYDVGFTSFVLHDTSRAPDPEYPGYPGERPVPVYLWYPADPGTGVASARYPLDLLYGQLGEWTSAQLEQYGTDPAWQEPPVSSARPFPVLIFSPPMMHSLVHASLAARLASHGFVVAVPYHIGDWWWWWEPYDFVEVAAYNRPRDMSFVLDRLLAMNTAPGLLKGALRPDSVAAGGWSFGGYAALTLAGGDEDICLTPTGGLHEVGLDCTLSPGTSSSPDRRFKAILSLSGAGMHLYWAELARVTVPMLELGEEWDYLAASGLYPASWHARTHAAVNGHPAYRVDVAGANHFAFSHFCDGDLRLLRELRYPDDYLGFLDYVDFMESYWCTPPAVSSPAETHRLISTYAVSFLKTQLAGEAGYQNVLTPGYALTREPGVEFFVTEKRNSNAISDEWPAEFVYFPHQPGSEQARGLKDQVAASPILRAVRR